MGPKDHLFGQIALALKMLSRKELSRAIDRQRSQPQAAIGEILGCSAHAVDQRIYRAMRRLARELADAGQRQSGMTTPATQRRGKTHD